MCKIFFINKGFTCLGAKLPKSEIDGCKMFSQQITQYATQKVRIEHTSLFLMTRIKVEKPGMGIL